MAIPKIDPNVKTITVGQLRRLAIDDLKSGKTFVVEDTAVVVPYDVFLQMQDALTAAPPMLASLPAGSVTASSARGFDASLGQRVPGTPGPASDSPLRGV